jgi:glucose-1-phosphate adenylyltransferase
VLFPNVKVSKNCKVIDSVLMPNVVVEEGAEIYKSIIASNITIKKGEKVGAQDSEEVNLVANEDLGLFE